MCCTKFGVVWESTIAPQFAHASSILVQIYIPSVDSQISVLRQELVFIRGIFNFLCKRGMPWPFSMSRRFYQNLPILCMH